MGTLFCPYTGEDVDAESMSLEHVVPEALGGSTTLSIRVERRANNRLGTDVDGPVCEFYALRRARLGLTGHSGTVPRAELKLRFPELDGQEGTLTLFPRSELGVRLRTTTTRRKLQDGSTVYSITGDPDRAREIFRSIERHHAAAGRMIKDHSETIRMVKGPRVEGAISVDMLALARFQVKLALGTCHWLAGEAWSRGASAAQLRRALWSQTLEEFEAAGLQFFPEEPASLNLRVDESEHLLILMEAPGAYALGMFMFGQTGYVLALSEPTSSALSTDSVAVLVNAHARTARRVSLLDLVKEGRVLFGTRDSKP
jgi:hypothetical protein